MQILYEKDAYLAPEHPRHGEFTRLTEQEIQHGLLRFSGYGPDKESWLRALAGRNLRLEGHALVTGS